VDNLPSAPERTGRRSWARTSAGARASSGLYDAAVTLGP